MMRKKLAPKKTVRKKTGRKTTLLACFLSVFLTACGGDYDSNPIVDEEGNVNPTEEVSSAPVDDFTEAQLTALQDNIWQSGCVNQKIIELTFSEAARTATVFSYDDSSCTEFASTTAQISVSPYTLFNTVQDSTGLDMTQIQFSTQLLGTIFVTRTVFVVESSRLYFGQSESGLDFSTALDFSMPYYSISESDRIEIEEEVNIISIPADDFSIVN